MSQKRDQKGCKSQRSGRSWGGGEYAQNILYEKYFKIKMNKNQLSGEKTYFYPQFQIIVHHSGKVRVRNFKSTVKNKEK